MTECHPQALSAFLYDYENIDIKWSAIEIEDEPHHQDADNHCNQLICESLTKI